MFLNLRHLLSINTTCTAIPALLALSAGCAAAPVDTAIDVEDATSALTAADIGFITVDCSREQSAAIKAAWDFLYTDIRGPLCAAQSGQRSVS